MIVVLDASAAIEVVLNRPKAESLAKSIAEAETVIVPDLFIPEVTNVFWKYHHIENLPVHLCETLITKTISLVDDILDSKELYLEAFSLACQSKHPVYDMLYLVVARRHNAILLTIDKRLKKMAKKHSIKVNPS